VVNLAGLQVQYQLILVRHTRRERELIFSLFSPRCGHEVQQPSKIEFSTFSDIQNVLTTNAWAAQIPQPADLTPNIQFLHCQQKSGSIQPRWQNGCQRPISIINTKTTENTNRITKASSLAHWETLVSS